MTTCVESTPIYAVTRFDTGDDLLEAQAILVDAAKTRERVFGPTHPEYMCVLYALSALVKKLHALESHP